MYKINKRIEIHKPLLQWEPPLAEFVFSSVAGDSTGHDIYHCLRVKRFALRIAEGEKLDKDIMVAAAYLHDIGREQECLREGDHVNIGMQAASKILPKIQFPSQKIEKVIQCIKYHEHYEWVSAKSNISEKISPEVLGFQDADRLDAVGAIGIARAFSFGGAHHQPIWIPENKPGFWQHGDISGSVYNHLYEKLFKLKNTMNTNTGLIMAEARHKFMKNFAEAFEKEWYGSI